MRAAWVTWRNLSEAKAAWPVFEPWRCIVPIVSLLVLGLISLLYVFLPPLYHSVLTVMVASPYKTPFLDFEAVFSTVQCAQRGIDIYVANPCDQLDRPLNYSPVWLRLGFLGVDRGWAVPAGLCFGILLCLTLYALPPTPRQRDRWVFCLAAVSSTTLFAVERGNMDLLVYFLALGAGFSLTRSAALRYAGYAALLLAALLKFYPLTAAIAVIRERLAACAAIAFGIAGVVICCFLALKPEIFKALHNIPVGSAFGDSVGSLQLPAGLAVAVRTVLPGDDATWLTSSPLLAPGVLIGLVVCVALAVYAVMSTGARRRLVASMPAPYAALFLIGASLLVGCFFSGPSIAYRGILFLLVLPGLLCLDDRHVPRRPRMVARFTVIAILIVMDRLVIYGAFKRHDLYPGNSVWAALWWFGFEALWWWIIAVLSAFLGCLVYESPAVQESLSRSFLKKKAAPALREPNKG